MQVNVMLEKLNERVIRLEKDNESMQTQIQGIMKLVDTSVQSITQAQEKLKDTNALVEDLYSRVRNIDKQITSLVESNSLSTKQIVDARSFAIKATTALSDHCAKIEAGLIDTVKAIGRDINKINDEIKKLKNR